MGVADATSVIDVVVRCDANASTGVGHLVRQLALIEELHARRHRVRLIGDSDLPWAIKQASDAGLNFEQVDDCDLTDWCLERGIAVAMLDGYGIDAAVGRGLRAAGIAVAAMVDGEFGAHQSADLYVDQNLGSSLPADRPGRWLVGPDYVLLRNVVLNRRHAERSLHDPRHVVVVFGGSDPFAGCPVAVQTLVATGEPVRVSAIAPTAERREQLEAITIAPHQQLTILGPQDDLPALFESADLAIVAAGSTVWELACMGVPAALVCVVDNQLLGYRAATRSLALGLGQLSELREPGPAREQATEDLRELLSDPARLLSMSSDGAAIVDGRGRQRVADALEALVSL